MLSLRRRTPGKDGCNKESGPARSCMHGFGVSFRTLNLVLICFYLLLPLIVLLFGDNAFAFPTFEEVKSSHKNSDAVLLDRHGKEIHELRVDLKGRQLEWVSLNETSPALMKAVIYSEDRRFYEHRGVDWKAAGAAAVGSDCFFLRLSSL